MKKTYILFILLLCSMSNVFAQNSSVVFSGLDTYFIVAKRLGSAQNVRDLKSAQGKTVDTLPISQKSENKICLLGANNKITLFVPRPNNVVEIKMTDKGFDFVSKMNPVDRFLSEVAQGYFYLNENYIVNTYLADVVCTKWVEPEKDFVDENYVSKLNAVKTKLHSDLKKLKIKDKELNEDLKLLVDQLYVESYVSAAKILMIQKKVLPKSLQDAILSFDFENGKLTEDMMDVYIHVVNTQNNKKYNDPKNYLAEETNVLPNQRSKDFYILSKLRGLISRQSYMFINDIVKSVEPLVSESSRSDFENLKGQITKATANNIKDGIPAHDFSFENQKGDVVSLSDFKGKYVYLDLWATWCGPCKQEIPNLMKLEKEFAKYDNIVFVSISADKQRDKEVWKKFLVDKDMHGNTLISDDAFNNPFMKYYGVRAIPRFMLIGPDGNMIANDCWRPGDPKMKDFLQKLLSK